MLLKYCLEEAIVVSILSEFKEKSSMHIGQEIEWELRSQGRTAVWFSHQLHCNRTNVYNIFKRSAIDTEQLANISRILHKDFFVMLSDELKGENKM